MTRFEKHLPYASAVVLYPGRALIIALVVAAIAAVFSVHHALSAIILWLGILSLYLERRLLDYVLMPPFSMMSILSVAGLGLGVSLYVIGSERSYHRELLLMQLVFILGFPIAWFGYWLNFRLVPRVVIPLDSKVFSVNVLRPLAAVGWVLLVFRVVQITILAAVGAEDRGDASITNTDEYFGLWSYLVLFQRFNNLGFFFVPLIWQRAQGASRMVLVGMLVFYFLVAFASGTRGHLLYPMIYIGVGVYLFRAIRAVKLDAVGLVFAIAALPVIVFVNYFRNTDAYRSSRTLDFEGRFRAVQAVGQLREQMSDSDTHSDLSVLGGALIGVSDSMVYRDTPSVHPHAGFVGFDGIVYTYVPTYFKRDKPILYDANFVIAEYLGYLDRTGRALSLEADAYRRFGWLGVPVCVFLSFFVLGLFTRWSYSVFLKRNALLGMLLVVFSFSFFNARPSGTVLTTWWYWSYDIAKHLVVLGMGYWMVRMFLYARTRSGALKYTAMALEEAKRARERSPAVRGNPVAVG